MGKNKKKKKKATPQKAKKKKTRRAGNRAKSRPQKRGRTKVTKKSHNIKIRKSKKNIRARIVKIAKKSFIPTYVLNSDFGSFFELRDLILKSLPAEKDTMIEKINKLGKVKLAVISGVFMNKENPDPYIPDLLIVGDDLDKRKLRSFLKAIEAEVGKEIKFVILDKEEFQYRLAMFDRFIRVLLEGPHEKLINKLGI
ncbi:MAG: hypothetical protein HYX20_00350 [Candidatus Yanofskybacteria bacterium]|nr:hypothetical protein [Candidatus Yanofskybacteria bacterium]